ncbi:hypothetical protein TFLX_02313 [Thermoflexales bacterium]|nr:hypothetical protein TFLX_02313 [Thermoflexales bacterium]
MKNSLLLGLWRYLLPIPRFIWQRQVRDEANLKFMSPDHHRVRDFVVMEIPRAGKPLSPDCIARALHLPADRLSFILDDLEKHMTFLFRNPQGEVEWAYPVTAACTPHHVTFSSGERIDAA